MANFGMKLLSFMQDKGPILGELKLLELFVCFSSVDATNEASSDADTSSHVQPFWHTLLPPVHAEKSYSRFVNPALEVSTFMYIIQIANNLITIQSYLRLTTPFCSKFLLATIFITW